MEATPVDDHGYNAQRASDGRVSRMRNESDRESDKYIEMEGMSEVQFSRVYSFF